MLFSRRRFMTSTAAAAALVARPALVRGAEPLVIGYIPGNAVHWIADVLIDKGFFRAQGFDAQGAVFQSSPQSIQLAITGAYQIASTQLEPLVAAVERGASNLGALSAPMNRADWVLVGASGVARLADLRGREIGVSALNSSEVWLTTQLLERNGFGRADVGFLVVGTSPAKATALQKGSLAAAVLFQPTAELAIAQGHAALARFRSLRAYLPTVYAVTREWARNGDAGKRVAEAFRRGHAWLWDPGNRSEAIDILAKYTKRDRPILEAVYDDYFVHGKIYSKTGEISLAGFDWALADMAEHNEIVKPPPPPAAKYVIEPALGGMAG